METALVESLVTTFEDYLEGFFREIMEAEVCVEVLLNN